MMLALFKANLVLGKPLLELLGAELLEERHTDAALATLVSWHPALEELEA